MRSAKGSASREERRQRAPTAMEAGPRRGGHDDRDRVPTNPGCCTRADARRPWSGLVTSLAFGTSRRPTRCDICAVYTATEQSRGPEGLPPRGRRAVQRLRHRAPRRHGGDAPGEGAHGQLGDAVPGRLLLHGPRSASSCSSRTSTAASRASAPPARERRRERHRRHGAARRTSSRTTRSGRTVSSASRCSAASSSRPATATCSPRSSTPRRRRAPRHAPAPRSQASAGEACTSDRCQHPAARRRPARTRPHARLGLVRRHRRRPAVLELATGVRHRRHAVRGAQHGIVRLPVRERPHLDRRTRLVCAADALVLARRCRPCCRARPRATIPSRAGASTTPP